MSSTPSRTFTVPLTKIETGEVITARVGNREIEVELESITAQTTRMRVVARNGAWASSRGGFRVPLLLDEPGSWSIEDETQVRIGARARERG